MVCWFTYEVLPEATAPPSSLVGGLLDCGCLWCAPIPPPEAENYYAEYHLEDYHASDTEE